MLLTEHLDRLTAYEPGPFPVISLYLDARVNDRGRREWGPLLDQDLEAQAASYPASSPERDSLERDIRKVRTYVENELDPATNAVAIFACAGADLFEAVQLVAQIDGHELYVSSQPHLYPLARLNDQYPRYAVLVANSNTARLFVVGNARIERAEAVESDKTRRTKVGGWSQARFQRRVDNFRQQHAKEAAEMLDRVVQAERIEHVILGGDETSLPLIKAELPKHLAERVIDIDGLTVGTSVREILEASLRVLREEDAKTDREKVDAMLSAWRARGLGTAGVTGTKSALEKGQVEELLITATPAAIAAPAASASAATGETADSAAPDHRKAVADELVTMARQTSARITFIEDPALLQEVGGVGALLRFRI
jgi:peptide chain release factor subunit 1